MPALFNLLASGSGSAGLELWINLGTIPLNLDNWIGSWTCTAVSKAMTFELRTNLTGQAAGTLAATKLLATMAPRAGSSLTGDLYKKGTLHTATVKGTTAGEKWWLRIVSKSSTAGNFTYQISYTQE